MWSVSTVGLLVSWEWITCWMRRSCRPLRCLVQCFQGVAQASLQQSLGLWWCMNSREMKISAAYISSTLPSVFTFLYVP